MLFRWEVDNCLLNCGVFRLLQKPCLVVIPTVVNLLFFQRLWDCRAELRGVTVSVRYIDLPVPVTKRLNYISHEILRTTFAYYNWLFQHLRRVQHELQRVYFLLKVAVFFQQLLYFACCRKRSLRALAAVLVRTEYVRVLELDLKSLSSCDNEDARLR